MINHEVSNSSIKEVISKLFVCIVNACDCLNNERDLNEVLDREVSFIILDIQHIKDTIPIVESDGGDDPNVSAGYIYPHQTPGVFTSLRAP